MKESSIEWLEDGVYKAIENTSENSINYVLEKLFEQAKQMHKQEIRRCCEETMKTCQTDMDELGLRTMNDYFDFVYNKTFDYE